MAGILSGQIALVTGGSRGIGRAVSIKLAELGAYVYINYNSGQAAAEETLAACKAKDGQGEIIGFSVGDSAAVTAAIEQILKKSGRIDILVNNAGISKDGLLMRMKDEDWAQTLNTNLSGAFYCARAVSRSMMKARSGRIINMSSITAEMGNAGQAAYVASKAGLIGLTKSMARELAPRLITVNAITPGFIDTEMTGALSEETKQSYMAQIPMERFGTTPEVANLVAFLAGPDSAYITGQVIGINGGMYM